MAERRSGEDGRDQPPEPEEVTSLRDEARRELADLAGHWQERLDAWDVGDAGGVASAEQRSLLADATRRFLRNRVATAAAILLLLYVLLSVFVPIFSDANATRVDYSQANLPVSLAHPFGTTPQGKDLFLLAWLGGRISLSIAFAVALVILFVGMLYGSIAGYVGGRLDDAMMRLLDALYGLPYLPFAIIAVAAITTRWPDLPPLAYMVPALTITTWFTAARIMRGQTLSLKANEYVESARAAGAGGTRIVTRHVIPNTLGVMVVAILLEVPNAILGEAFLSFLGLGVQPPAESWGTLAQKGYLYIDSQPLLIWVPGLLIATTVLAAIAVADGLRDALDPRGRVN